MCVYVLNAVLTLFLADFISLDCGTPRRSYTDNATGINDVRDDDFIESGDQDIDLAIKDDAFKQRHQQYTYSEVKSITNNFTTVIGKGGFGAVFRGSIGGNQVAVKILSDSSAQGYKEFQAEVKLLMDVRHKNIALLLGYCNEGNHKGIIYEYMANGNLGQHLFVFGVDISNLEGGVDGVGGVGVEHAL
ncbi:leucine-rich repeat transmembrane protein kinase protein [Tanacetum coccineum]